MGLPHKTGQAGKTGGAHKRGPAGISNGCPVYVKQTVSTYMLKNNSLKFNLSTHKFYNIRIAQTHECLVQAKHYMFHDTKLQT